MKDFQGRSPAGVPAHRTGLDGWLFRLVARATTPHRADRGPHGALLPGRSTVVAGSAEGITENGVGGLRPLQCRVRGGLARRVTWGARVRVVLPHERSVGTPDLVLGRLRAEAQDGIQVVPVTGHDDV